MIIHLMYDAYLIHWQFYLVSLCHHGLSPNTRIQGSVIIKSEFRLMMKKFTCSEIIYFLVFFPKHK